MRTKIKTIINYLLLLGINTYIIVVVIIVVVIIWVVCYVDEELCHQWNHCHKIHHVESATPIAITWRGGHPCLKKWWRCNHNVLYLLSICLINSLNRLLSFLTCLFDWLWQPIALEPYGNCSTFSEKTVHFTALPCTLCGATRISHT